MKKLFVALLLVLLAQPLPAQAQNNSVWLPLMAGGEAPCKFEKVYNQVWITILKTHPTEAYLYVYSQTTDSDNYPIVLDYKPQRVQVGDIADTGYVYQAVIQKGEDRVMQCDVNFNEVSAAAIPNPVADPPAVPGLFLWTWVNWKIDKETHEGFSLSCQAWADKLWVYALILNQDTGKTTERLVHQDETCCLIHAVSCSQSEALVVYEPELLMSVRFETDIDTAVTVERKDFRWLAWLPFIESN